MQFSQRLLEQRSGKQTIQSQWCPEPGLLSLEGRIEFFVGYLDFFNFRKFGCLFELVGLPWPFLLLSSLELLFIFFQHSIVLRRVLQILVVMCTANVYHASCAEIFLCGGPRGLLLCTRAWLKYDDNFIFQFVFLWLLGYIAITT